MPFEDLETVTKDNLPPQATVTYSHATEKSKRAGNKPRLTIAIPTTICGTAKVDRFRLLIGSGADEGKLRVSGIVNAAAKKDKGPEGVKPSEHAHFFRWNFGYVPRLGDEETFEGEKCPVSKISDNEFEIAVPKSWFAPK